MTRYDNVFLERIVAKDGRPDKLYDTIHKVMLENYPEAVLGWMKTATWKLTTVLLSDIQMARRPGGRNDKKTEAIAEAVRSGKMMDPVVLVETGKNQYEIADGFHRTLGLQRAGKKSTRAYIASGNVEGFDKEAIHAAKQNVEPGEKAQADGPIDTTPVGGSPNGNVPAERYPTTPLTVKPGGPSPGPPKTINVRVADTPAARSAGFQNTPEPTDYDGMLFSWPGDANAAIHAAGVTFPLSAQWADQDGNYVDHRHLLAGDETPQRPKGNHRHLLEVPTHLYDSLGLGPGSQISMGAEKNQQTNGTIPLQ